MAYYKNEYDGYVPNKIAGALAGHMDDDEAENMIQESIRYQGGVYDFDMANVSTKIFNKYKDRIIQSTALTPGSDDEARGKEWVLSWTNEASEDSFGKTDIKSPKWIALRDNLQAIFDRTYVSTYMRNGQVVSTPEQAMEAAMQAVEKAASNSQAVINMSNTDYGSDDETYSRMIQVSMLQSAGGKWKTNKITSNAEIEKGLVNWNNSPLKQLKDIPSYYRDLALRLGVNPINFANAQVRFLVEDEVKDDNTDDKLDEKIPLDTERGYHIHFKNYSNLLSRPVVWADRGFGITPMEQGLRVVGTVEFGGLENPLSKSRIKNLILNAKDMLNGLPENEDHEDEWLGFRPTLPDFLPVIGKSKNYNNVYYYFGHHHLGWTLGAISGKIVSKMILGEKTNLDLSPYSSSRFN